MWVIYMKSLFARVTYDIIEMEKVIETTQCTRGFNMQTLSDKAKEARRAYKRKWNQRNKDKVQAAQARYWERKAREAAEAETSEA